MPNLTWKEWREQRWKLGYGAVVLGSMAFIGLHTRIIADQTMVMWCCFLGLLLTVSYSTGLVPAERGEGSLKSLLALPVAPWRILLAKTLMGLVLCVGPMLVAAVVSVFVTQGREMDESEMIAFYARATLACIAMFIWMTALTITLPNETRGGLLGLGVFIFWVMATAGLAYPPGDWLGYGMAISPLAFVYNAYGDRAVSPLLGLVLGVQAVILALLWFWASRRLSADVEGES